jgi:hypothetical protein
MVAKEPVSPGLINLIVFRGQKASFALSHEYHLWEIDVRINPIKNFVTMIIGKWVRRNMAKELQGIPWQD